MPANLENSAVTTGLEKVSFHASPQERQCKECSNYCTIVLISHTSKVKWTIGSITMNKASESNGTPVKLFQILRDDAVKVLHSTCQRIWKIQQWLQDWKRSVFISIPQNGNAKECSKYCTIALISHAS